MMSRRNRRASRGWIAAISAVGIVAAVLTATPASAASRPTPDLGTPVPGHAVTGAGKHPKTNASAEVPSHHSVAAGTYSLNLPSGAGNAATTNVKRVWQSAGSAGVRVAAAIPSTNATKQPSTTVKSVTLSVLDGAEVKKRGLHGLVISAARTDGGNAAAPLAVQIPQSLLNGLYGADYASRLRWLEVPASAAKSATAAQKSATAVPATISSDSTVMTPTISAAPMLLMAEATASSSTGTGSFTATPLNAATMWDVSAQTGDFSWSYPLRTPPVAAGPQPDIALSYDSQSVDGETSATNNQPSSIGEGWSLGGGGFIERSYVPCATDDGPTGPIAGSGDLCWKADNATLSLGGHAGQLIQIGTTGEWRLQADDGTRIQHVAGSPNCATNGTYDNDCWVVTTTNGTRYFFGSRSSSNSAWTVPVFGNDPGEPCNDTSWCSQAWRWNLDEVVDIHNNAEVYYYNSQNNLYSRSGTTPTSYIRGGELAHIDYGMTASTVTATNAASATVTFGYDPFGRCNDASHANCTTEPATGLATTPTHPEDYTDIPYDQNCTSGNCTGLISPTFWSNSTLTTVTTTSWSAGTASKVDVWTLDHSFPDPQDGGAASLWLTKVTHTGYSGGTSLSEPPTVFTGGTKQGRVWVIDGLAPLNKYRLTNITSSLGATTTITYSGQQCTPAEAPAIEASPWSNNELCFPQTWVPTGNQPRTDLFHKYVVLNVAADPVNSTVNDQIQQTTYDYGTPGWRYETSPLVPATQRTWSRFAGFNTVKILVGDPSSPTTQHRTDYTFYQGLDKDRASSSGGQKTVFVTGTTTVPDSLWFAGQTRETTVYNGAAGTAVSDTTSTPWVSAATATDSFGTAYLTGSGTTSITTPTSTGTNHQTTTTTTTTHDATYGYPVTVDIQHSDGATPSCTRTDYATANRTAWLIGLPGHVSVVSVPCATTPSHPADAVSESNTYYDNATATSTAPSAGDVTKTETVASYSGTTPQFAQTSTTSYDPMGRPLVVTDALQHKTTTSYTPAAGASEPGSLTSMSITNNSAPVAWTTTTAYVPAWGAIKSVTDQNNKITTATYDALGRRTAVWNPGNDQATHPADPNTAYAYTLSQTTFTAIATTTLAATTKVTSYDLYDGLGQKLQSQSPSPGGSGTLVSDYGYDSAGQSTLTYNPYWTVSVNPSTTLFVPNNAQNIPSVTATVLDGAGRTTAVITRSMGNEKFRTTNAYPYTDEVDTTPPAGAAPTSTFTNSLGQKLRLVQYQATTISGSAPTITTTYGYDNRGDMTSMKDQAQNTWTWTYDLLGHQTGAVDPDTGSSTSTYDIAGNLLTSTDARGTTLAYQYDALNRKTAVHNGSTSGALLTSWSYDAVAGAAGQLTSSTSYQGSGPGTPGAAYVDAITGYDTAYKPTGEKISIPAGAPAFANTSYSFAMTYNRDETIKKRTIPAMGGLAAESISYTYDRYGQLNDTYGTDDYGSVTYTAIGQIAQIDRGLYVEVASGNSYDAATGRLMGKTETEINNSVTTTPATLAYARDAAGDVTSLKNTGIGTTDTQCFSYDYLQNLTEAWTPSNNTCDASGPTTSTALGGGAPYWTSYSIDDVTGNRTKTIAHPIVAGGAATTSVYAYPLAGGARPHAVQTVTSTGGSTSTATFGYDSTGNTIVRPSQTLTWDAQGKLSTVVAGGKTQSNVYGADGSLLLQTDPTSGSTLFIGETQLHIAAGAATISAVRDYTVAGVSTAERTTKVGVAGSVLFYTATDENDTIYLEVNVATGAVTKRYVDPYGNSRGTTSMWSSINRYLNKPADTFDGLTQLGARAYDPQIGKFVSADAIFVAGQPQQDNGYSYSSNNPITSSDATGNCYQTNSDSLDMHTNCVGSSGSTAGRGAAYVSHQAPLAAGNSSSDYGIYHAVTSWHEIDSTDAADESGVGREVAVGKAYYYGGSPNYVPTPGSEFARQMPQYVGPVVLSAVLAFPLLACTAATDGFCAAAAAEGVAEGVSEEAQAARTYQTYTKYNPETGETYAGRTSGYGSPAENVARRDASHAYNKRGYDPAELDQSSSNPGAIRGREQQLIDQHKSMGSSGNAINGISLRNPNYSAYMQSAWDLFGRMGR